VTWYRVPKIFRVPPGPLVTLLCKLICVHLSLAFVHDTCSTKFFILAQGRVVFKKPCLFASFCRRLAATYYCFISFLTSLTVNSEGSI